MGVLDAECSVCETPIRWLTGTARLCAECRAKGCKERPVDKADSDAVRSTLLSAWVDDIEGLDTL